jgi:hypothetical protein
MRCAGSIPKGLRVCVLWSHDHPEQEASVDTTKSDVRATVSAAEAAIRRSVDRIESNLDRVTPQARKRLDQAVNGLRRRLEDLSPVAESVGDAAWRGSRKAEETARALTGRLAESAEHLADVVSDAPVPASRKAVSAGQKAIADAARSASAELRRTTGARPATAGILIGVGVIAALVTVLRALQRSRRS